jgi:hypothetical protein
VQVVYLVPAPEPSTPLHLLSSSCCSLQENYKKDQMVYKIGDEPEKFYIILTGG